MADTTKKAEKEEKPQRLPPKMKAALCLHKCYNSTYEGIALMKAALCLHKCYNSTESTLYEDDKTYEVDVNDPWVQLHFEVPSRKEAE